MSVEPDKSNSHDYAASIAPMLLGWYDANARILPWRAPPGTNAADPYAVWLSEIMLQQTTVQAVAPYFARFLARWPSVHALASAAEEDVMAAWAGLGYYARARNLMACARAVSRDHGGRFPDNEDDLRDLPGVGAYTAAAIAAIAFGRRAVVIDANVERVIARLFAMAEPLPAIRRAIRMAADSITPDARAGDFAQAMMDLGSSLCSVRQPACLACPLRNACRAHAQGIAEKLPVKAPKKPRPQRHGTAWWIERNGHVWLARRPKGGMLGGMMAFPDDGWRARTDGDGTLPAGCLAEAPLGTVDHVFTHFALRLTLRRAVLSGNDPPPDGRWWPIDRLDEAGLPTLFAKAAALCRATAD